jgi:hypothetical protein
VEAHQLTSEVLAGHEVRPRFHAHGATALADKRDQTPEDKLDVARAKQRRDVLLRYKSILEGRRVDVTTERQEMRDRRRRLDDSMAALLAEMQAGFQAGLLSSPEPIRPGAAVRILFLAPTHSAQSEPTWPPQITPQRTLTTNRMFRCHWRRTRLNSRPTAFCTP